MICLLLMAISAPKTTCWLPSFPLDLIMICSSWHRLAYDLRVLTLADHITSIISSVFVMALDWYGICSPGPLSLDFCIISKVWSWWILVQIVGSSSLLLEPCSFSVVAYVFPFKVMSLCIHHATSDSTDAKIWPFKLFLCVYTTTMIWCAD